MFYNSFLTLVGQYYPKLKQTKRNQVNIDYISKCKCKITNHLKYNIGENLGDFEHGNFLNTASKVWPMKENIDKLDFIIIKNICFVGENVNRIRRQAID